MGATCTICVEKDTIERRNAGGGGERPSETGPTPGGVFTDVAAVPDHVESSLSQQTLSSVIVPRSAASGGTQRTSSGEPSASSCGNGAVRIQSWSGEGAELCACGSSRATNPLSVAAVTATVSGSQHNNSHAQPWYDGGGSGVGVGGSSRGGRSATTAGSTPGTPSATQSLADEERQLVLSLRAITRVPSEMVVEGSSPLAGSNNTAREEDRGPLMKKVTSPTLDPLPEFEAPATSPPAVLPPLTYGNRKVPVAKPKKESCKPKPRPESQQQDTTAAVSVHPAPSVRSRPRREQPTATPPQDNKTSETQPLPKKSSNEGEMTTDLVKAEKRKLREVSAIEAKQINRVMLQNYDLVSHQSTQQGKSSRREIYSLVPKEGSLLQRKSQSSDHHHHHTHRRGRSGGSGIPVGISSSSQNNNYSFSGGIPGVSQPSSYFYQTISTGSNHTTPSWGGRGGIPSVRRGSRSSFQTLLSSHNSSSRGSNGSAQPPSHHTYGVHTVEDTHYTTAVTPRAMGRAKRVIQSEDADWSFDSFTISQRYSARVVKE